MGTNIAPQDKRGHVTGGTLVAALRNAMLTLLVLNVLAQFLPAAPVWITDNGNKYIVMRSIAETLSPAIRHPAQEFFPTGGFHFVRHRGNIRSFYPEYYPALAAMWWKLTGDRGLVWLSMLGTTAVIGLLTLMIGERRGLAPLLLVFATPMLFFSFLLWEMTWSVFALLSAWILVQKKRYLVAGAVLGASLQLREEAYFFAFALTVALACRKDFRGAVNFLLGAAALTLPIWFCQYVEFGHIFGLHGGNYYANNRASTGFSLLGELKGVAWNYYHHLLRFNTGKTALLNPLCLIPAMLAVISGVFTSQRFDKIKLAAGIAAVAGWSALVLTYLFRTPDNEAFTAAMITGAIGSNPLFLPFYLNWRRAWQSRSTVVRDAAVTSCVYLLLVPPLMTRSDIGLIYGARHFLCIMPLMLFLSVHFVHRKFMPGKFRLLFPAAATIAILLQFGAFTALRNVATESADFEQAVNSMPEKTVVTDVFFIPEQTPHLFFDKDVFRLDNVPALLEYLKRSGRRDFVLLLSADRRFRRIDNERLAVLLNAAEPAAPPTRFRRVPGSGFMDLHIVRCRLK